MCETKVCSKCDRELPATSEYFHKDASRKDGLSYVCRECRSGKNEHKKESKKCKTCKETYPLTKEHFRESKGSKDGYSHICTKCKIKKRDVGCKEGYKKCIKCQRELEINEIHFKKDELGLDGHRNVCRECEGGKFEIPQQKQFWTEQDDDILKEYYSIMSNKELVDKFFPTRTEQQIGDYATKKLNLNKDKEYLRQMHWSDEQVEYVKESYANTDTREMSKKLNKSEDTIRAMAIKLKINKENYWEQSEIELLEEKYPNMKNKDIQELYFPNRSYSSVVAMALKLNLTKDEKYLDELRKEIGIANLELIGDNSGENHPRFNSIKVPCYQCGNPVLVNEAKLNNQERVHCSRECAGKSVSERLTGNEEFGRKISESWTEEMRLKQAELAVKRLENAHDKPMTEPQKITNEILDELEIIYKNEYNCKYYSIDNYISNYNLMIEVQGNFYHCNPTMNLANIREIKIVGKDKAKHTYVKKYYDVDILYLWEKDLKQNKQVCEELIKHYIGNDGKIENYHSFNYSLIDGKLVLNNEIIEFAY